MIHGLDLSAYQPHFNLEDAYNDAFEPRFFIYKETEGEKWVSDVSPAQWEALEGIVANYGPLSAFGGSYHFCRWDTPRNVVHDAIEEADWLWKREQIRRKAGHGAGVRILPPTADLEWIPGKKRDPTSLLQWALAFCQRTEEQWGVAPITYIGTAFWRYCLLPALVPGSRHESAARALCQYILWVVDYNSPEGEPKDMKGTEGAADKGPWPWLIHQFSGSGKVNGIYTNSRGTTRAKVDLNVFNGSMADLARLTFSV